MKYLLTIILSFGCFAFANASELPSSVSAEYFGCKLDDNKDLNDLNTWVKKWNRWMDSSDLGEYEASLLTPLYRSPNDELDFMWVGRTNSWKELARGQSAYRSSGLADTFPAKSCPFSFIARQIPVNGTDFRDQMNQDEFVAAYWLCNIEKGKSIEDVYSLQERRMKNISESGNAIASRIVVPRQGTPEAIRDYDFVMLYVSPSLEQWGANVDNYVTNIQGSEEDSMDGVFNCDHSTVYVGRTVR